MPTAQDRHTLLSQLDPSPRVAFGPLVHDFDEVVEAARGSGPARVVVASPEHEEVLAALARAEDLGLALPVLVGDERAIRGLAERSSLDASAWRIVDEPDPALTSIRAATIASEEGGAVLMKGRVQTADLLRAVLSRELGLRRAGLVSHVWVTELAEETRLVLVSDAGVVILPTLEEKVQITKNAVEVAHALGIETPRVAVLAALEQVNPRVRSTTDAAILAKMGDRGQLRGVVIDGPLTLDTALGPRGAGRGYTSPVEGSADVLIVPHIEAGNALTKSLTYFRRGLSAGIVHGAAVPVVLTSRADSEDVKLASIALAVLVRARTAGG